MLFFSLDGWVERRAVRIEKTSEALRKPLGIVVYLPSVPLGNYHCGSAMKALFSHKKTYTDLKILDEWCIVLIISVEFHSTVLKPSHDVHSIQPPRNVAIKLEML